MRTKWGSAGFTIVELTIASAVFSLVLLVALTSFLGIGKVYYKSASIAQTQNTTQQIINQVTSDVQNGASVGAVLPTGTGANYVCIGNVRYTFILYKKVDPNNHDYNNNFGLVRDILPGSTSCGNPFGTGAIAFYNPTELLQSKMRVSNFTIAPAKDSGGVAINNLWSFSVKVAYGDDDVLQNPGNGSVACDSNLSQSEFCSVSDQTTSISRGY